jgi:hypothetical protein
MTIFNVYVVYDGSYDSQENIPYGRFSSFEKAKAYAKETFHPGDGEITISELLLDEVPGHINSRIWTFANNKLVRTRYIEQNLAVLDWPFNTDIKLEW